MSTELYIKQEQIKEAVRKASNWLRKYVDAPVFVGILTGAVAFTVDLTREYGHRCSIDFIRIKTYKGRYQNKKPYIDTKLSLDIENKAVVLVEDIIDTGKTVDAALRYLWKQNPRSIVLMSLFGPRRRYFDVDEQYFLFETPPKNKYVFGYGMDDDENYREVRNIWAVER